MNNTERQERRRRLKLRLAALKRHKAARGPDGKSKLAVSAGKASARCRKDDRAWGLELALKRWYPEQGSDN